MCLPGIKYWLYIVVEDSKCKDCKIKVKKVKPKIKKRFIKFFNF